MNYTQTMRFCASMAVNFSTLALAAQHMKDSEEDKFNAYMIDEEENASSDDVHAAFIVIGKNVWRLRKDPSTPTLGAMKYYDSCVVQFGKKG